MSVSPSAFTSLPLSRRTRDQWDTADTSARARLLQQWAADGLCDLPLPGSGRTLDRWRALGEVAAYDLAMLKLYEGHTDALAILHEAGSEPPQRSLTWGMWAAEAPQARVIFTQAGDTGCILAGSKAWCSGARYLDRALLTVWMPSGEGPYLAAVNLRQDGVTFDGAAWQAVGMCATGSETVSFDRVGAELIGPAEFYLKRAGFWQGGAGVAACWHGAASALAAALRQQTADLGMEDNDPGWHRFMALGAVDRALAANAALLREAAVWIDEHPRDSAITVALRVRCAAEAAAELTIHHVTRAMGATPLCRDAWFARMAADLPVFTRQSHGDRDLAALGRAALHEETPSWRL